MPPMLAVIVASRETRSHVPRIGARRTDFLHGTVASTMIRNPRRWISEGAAAIDTVAEFSEGNIVFKFAHNL